MDRPITSTEHRELDALADDIHNLPPERQAQAMASIREAIQGDAELQTMTLAELADIYDVSVKTLRREIDRGDLKAAKIGRGYHVTIASVRAWIARKTVNNGA